MAYSDSITLNGTDITDLGLAFIDFGPWWSGPRYSRSFASPAGQMGAFPATETMVEPRALQLELALPASSLAARIALLDEVHRNLEGLIEVAFGDDSDRVAYGIVQEIQTHALGPTIAHNVGDLRPRITIVFYDVCKYDRYATALAIPAAIRTTVPLGTAPSHGILTAFGSAAGFSVTYRPHGGTGTEGLAFTTTLTSSDAQEMDLSGRGANGGLVNIASGVRSSAMNALSSGWFFALDPKDSPTLEMDNCSGVLYYRRRWLS
jgi:hypothetical protein